MSMVLVSTARVRRWGAPHSIGALPVEGLGHEPQMVGRDLGGLYVHTQDASRRAAPGRCR